MDAKCYRLSAGRLCKEPLPETGAAFDRGDGTEGTWLDVLNAEPAELRGVLEPLDLHPLQLKRCTDAVEDPGVVAFGDCLLAEYPAFLRGGGEPATFLSLILKGPLLVTIRHGLIPGLDELGGTWPQPRPHPSSTCRSWST